MSQPTPYTRQQNFTSWQASNPGVWPQAVDLDAEFNAVKTNLDGLNTNIALIQRDDGRLKNASVGIDQLDSTTYALLDSNLNPRGAWYTALSYAVGDLVSVNSGTASYVCATAHTAGTFATDLANGYWILLGGINIVSPGTVTALNFVATGTTADTLPSGTTAQRPGAPTAGMLRWNTDLSRTEFYTGAAWVSHARLTGDTFTGTVLAPAFTQNGNAVLDTNSALNGAKLTAATVPSTALATDTTTQRPTRMARVFAATNLN